MSPARTPSNSPQSKHECSGTQTDVSPSPFFFPTGDGPHPGPGVGDVWKGKGRRGSEAGYVLRRYPGSPADHDKRSGVERARPFHTVLCCAWPRPRECRRDCRSADCRSAKRGGNRRGGNPGGNPARPARCQHEARVRPTLSRNRKMPFTQGCATKACATGTTLRSEANLNEARALPVICLTIHGVSGVASSANCQTSPRFRPNDGAYTLPDLVRLHPKGVRNCVPARLDPVGP